jgi:hypothetical protein
MPLSIFDSSASKLSNQTAIEAYTHAMQAYTLSQVSSLDLTEDRKISDRNFDDIPINGRTPQPMMPISLSDSSAGIPSTCSAMEDYTHSMQAYVISRMSFIKRCETHGIADRESDDVLTSDVLYQGPGPPIAAELEEAAGQLVNGAYSIQA